MKSKELTCQSFGAGSERTPSLPGAGTSTSLDLEQLIGVPLPMSIHAHHQGLTGPDGIFYILLVAGKLVSTRVEDRSTKVWTPHGYVPAPSKFHVVMATEDLVADLKRWASRQE